jgi:hypothetical protein
MVEIIKYGDTSIAVVDKQTKRYLALRTKNTKIEFQL